MCQKPIPNTLTQAPACLLYNALGMICQHGKYSRGEWQWFACNYTFFWWWNQEVWTIRSAAGFGPNCILVLFYQTRLRPGIARNHMRLAQPSMLHVITWGCAHSSDWGLNQDVGKQAFGIFLWIISFCTRNEAHEKVNPQRTVAKSLGGVSSPPELATLHAKASSPPNLTKNLEALTSELPLWCDDFTPEELL